ncbi:hypothetical protein PILCRDRAFT_824621 [Piloderma croceum F 1598]|uniref:Uncharacterized protein n=1 Tax=Piloderma croceum (strain F 1598) TaxID=765440 RepID=A0A0C3F060_PILCF|nr:hypothetical protein PILCRDRAFT_824621 [Piloderma croceum F 1598]
MVTSDLSSQRIRLPFTSKLILSSTMILVGYFTALISIPIIFANAASVPRASTGKCYTITSGYLSASIDNSADLEALDLNSDEELTLNNGTAVQAAFQACPEATQNSGYNYTGRLVIEPTSSNKCLTITNLSSSNGPYFVKSENCTSDTTPSEGELWGYGNDFGDVIFGAGGCGPGILLKSNGEPKLASRNRLEFSCNGTFESMTLTNTTG